MRQTFVLFVSESGSSKTEAENNTVFVCSRGDREGYKDEISDKTSKRAASGQDFKPKVIRLFEHEMEMLR